MDTSLLYDTRPSWRRDHRIPMVVTLRRIDDGCGPVDDLSAAGGTDALRVWGCAQHILRDALEGSWLGSRYGSGETLALRYAGPVEGEGEEWIDLTADLRALALLGTLFGLLSGADGDWPWALDLVGEPAMQEAA